MKRIYDKSMYDTQTAIYKSIEDLEEGLEESVARAQDLYNEFIAESNLLNHDDYDLWNAGDVSRVDEHGVEISWEVTWRYGGHAEGEYTIPLKALLDETWEDGVREAAHAFLKWRRAI